MLLFEYYYSSCLMSTCNSGLQGAAVEAAAPPAVPAEAAAGAASAQPCAESSAPEPSADGRDEDGDAGAEGKVRGTEPLLED